MANTNPHTFFLWTLSYLQAILFILLFALILRHYDTVLTYISTQWRLPVIGTYPFGFSLISWCSRFVVSSVYRACDNIHVGALLRVYSVTPYGRFHTSKS